jgi:diacylglycerol kinase
MTPVHKNDGIFPSVRNAFSGLKKCITSENNAIFHLVVTIFVIAAGLLFRLSLIHWLFLLLAISLVWITELFNTAIEFLFDVSQPKIDHRVKYAKAISAGAVLIAALFSLIVGILILVPPFIKPIVKLFS